MPRHNRLFLLLSLLWLALTTIPAFAATYSSRTEYRYDAAGNRTALVEKDGSGQVVRNISYQYDARGALVNQSDSTDGSHISYSYDANGNLTARSDSALNLGWAFEYDSRDQLLRVREHGPTDPPTELASYRYNADGLRSDKASAAGQFGYVWDDDSLWLALRNTQAIQQYQYGPDDLLTMKDDGSFDHPTISKAQQILNAKARASGKEYNLEVEEEIQREAMRQGGVTNENTETILSLSRNRLEKQEALNPTRIPGSRRGK